MSFGVSVNDSSVSPLKLNLNAHAAMRYELMNTGMQGREFSQSKRIRLAIADDHPLVILAIEWLAGNFPNVEVISRSANSTQLDESLAGRGCDVAIVDFHMPGGRFGNGSSFCSTCRFAIRKCASSCCRATTMLGSSSKRWKRARTRAENGGARPAVGLADG